MAKILIVEDNQGTNKAICEYMKEAGHTLFSAFTGSEALKIFREKELDIIVLDIMLPEMSGIVVLHEIRKVSNIPVIMLTALDDEYTQSNSFDEMADDYITKPYNPTILLLRINAVFKRLGAKSDNTTTYRGMEILPHKGVIKYKDEEITLTKNEMTIFMYLLSHREHIVSRDELMTELWNNEEYLNDNALTVNISRLRGRFKDIGLEDVIETRKGQGYILV